MGAKGYELSAQSGELRASIVDYGQCLLNWRVLYEGEYRFVRRIVKSVEDSAMPESASPRKARRHARRIERMLARIDRKLSRRAVCRQWLSDKANIGRGPSRGVVAMQRAVSERRPLPNLYLNDDGISYDSGIPFRPMR